jgi:hypothetical protein
MSANGTAFVLAASQSGTPAWLTPVIAASAAILAAAFTAGASAYAARRKVTELELSNSFDQAKQYLESARNYTRTVYLPLSAAVYKLHNEFLTFKAADPEQAKAADPEQAKAADPEQAKAADPEQAKAADPEQAKAADPEQAKAADPEQAKAADPEQAKAADPEQAKAADPEQAKAADPEEESAESRFMTECRTFISTTDGMFRSGAGAVLTLRLDESITFFVSFLRESLTAERVIKSSFLMRNIFKVSLDVLSIAAPGMGAVSPILSALIDVGGLQSRSKPAVAAAPITSDDFKKQFVLYIDTIKGGIKEVTLGGYKETP